MYRSQSVRRVDDRQVRLGAVFPKAAFLVVPAADENLVVRAADRRAPGQRQVGVVRGLDAENERSARNKLWRCHQLVWRLVHGRNVGWECTTRTEKN